MSNEFYLPRDTASLLTENRMRQCKNLGLILDKYPPRMAVQKSEGKSSWLKEIASGSYIDARLAECAYQRWLRVTTAQGALHFSAVTDWRMVVGLGGETVLETDLTLHHLYGFPYIPGSALKGLTRAYAAGEIYPSTDIEHDNPIVKHIFGTQEEAGTVIFFDAMPVNGQASFLLDIMNSHYPNYYGEKKPPTNDQNPNPVTFLTVANTTFMFALAPRRHDNEQDLKDVELAKEWLQAAIAKYGVGGKTSAGYGYFKEIREEQEATLTLQVAQSETKPQEPKPIPAPTERIRPAIPQFRAGQELNGAVVEPNDDLRKLAPDAKAFLRYQSFALKDVVMFVNTAEAESWQPGQTRICLLMGEEVRDGCTLLICQPRPSKNKDKKKK